MCALVALLNILLLLLLLCLSDVLLQTKRFTNFADKNLTRRYTFQRTMFWKAWRQTSICHTTFCYCLESFYFLEFLDTSHSDLCRSLWGREKQEEKCRYKIWKLLNSFTMSSLVSRDCEYLMQCLKDTWSSAVCLWNSGNQNWNNLAYFKIYY